MQAFKAWMNPLKCPEIENDLTGSNTPSAERLLDYLFAPEGDRGSEAFVRRYRDIASEPDPLPFAPHEQNILEKLVWPLRSAKGSYALGNYIGCIALCGMVGEMVAIVLWNISQKSVQQKPIDEKTERDLLGRSFERLGQERRAAVLHTLGIIGKDTSDAFEGLREIRRKYLHFFSQPHERVEADARQAYKHTLKLVENVLGQSLVNGQVVHLRADLVKYLLDCKVIYTTPD